MPFTLSPSERPAPTSSPRSNGRSSSSPRPSRSGKVESSPSEGRRRSTIGCGRRCSKLNGPLPVPQTTTRSQWPTRAARPNPVRPRSASGPGVPPRVPARSRRPLALPALVRGVVVNRRAAGAHLEPVDAAAGRGAGAVGTGAGAEVREHRGRRTNRKVGLGGSHRSVSLFSPL